MLKCKAKDLLRLTKKDCKKSTQPLHKSSSKRKRQKMKRIEKIITQEKRL